MAGPGERQPAVPHVSPIGSRGRRRLHPTPIDLGLDRLQRTLDRLDWRRPACPVITVAGTNGKGSCVALLDAHPHERRLSRRPVHLAAPAALQRAHPHRRRRGVRRRAAGGFERIDAARGDDHADVLRIQRARRARSCSPTRSSTRSCSRSAWAAGSTPSTSSMPTSRWSRSIGLDHCDWLGHDREDIGREKAGIFRAGRPGDLRRARHAGVDSRVGAADRRRPAAARPRFRLDARPGQRWNWRGAERRATRVAAAGPARRDPIRQRCRGSRDARGARIAAARASGGHRARSADVALPGRFQVVRRTARDRRVDSRCRPQPRGCAHAGHAALRGAAARGARSRCAACWATRTSRQSSASCATRSTAGSSSALQAPAR